MKVITPETQPKVGELGIHLEGLDVKTIRLFSSNGQLFNSMLITHLDVWRDSYNSTQSLLVNMGLLNTCTLSSVAE